MAPFNPAASLSQTSYALQALEVLFTPAPSMVSLDPGKGLFSSQATDFQSSLKTAEKNWSQDPPQRRFEVNSDPPPAPPNSAGSAPAAASAEPPIQNPAPAQTAEPVQPAAVPTQGPGAAPTDPGSAPGAGTAASGEAGRVGAIGPGSSAALESPAASVLAGQPVGGKGEIFPAAQGAPSAEVAGSQEQLLKHGAGTLEKAAAGETVQGLASHQPGKADSQASDGSRSSGSGSDLHNALNGSGAKFAKGAFGDTPSGGRLSANIAAQFTNAPSTGPGALSGGAAASLLKTAGRAMTPGTASAQPGTSISEGLAASSANPLASQPAGALALTASGKIGGVASLDSAVAAKTSPAMRADLIQQVVRNAALVVRNGRPEIRVDLKPESLGTIKLHVTTVNHQVQVKIVAQTQMVKEILEGSLNQLKLDLLNHKLDVERFEVTVAGDPERGFAEPRSWAGAQRERNSSSPGRDDLQDATSDDQRERHHRDPLQAQSRGRVDYFV